MSMDYYALLTKAVAGKDTVARGKIYKDAYDLIQRSSIPKSDIPSHVAALEDAVRQIENDIADRDRDDETPAAEIEKVLSTGPNWKALATIAFGAVVAIGLSALFYQHLSTKDKESRPVATASARQPVVRADSVVPDLDPGVDGGSSAADLPFSLQRQVVFYRTTIVPGSIVVDRESRFLYLIEYNNSARRYGIGIAKECLKGGSFFRITNKLEWLDWHSFGADASKNTPVSLPATVRSGSPLGSRALLLDKPGLIIHGTNSPKTIGHLVASGCIRLVNDDVEDLYRRVPLETRVIFVS